MEPIYLERWLHEKIRQMAQDDPQFCQFLGKEDLEQISRSDVDRYHLYKTKMQLDYVYRKSTFYRRLFDAQKIDPACVNSLQEFARLPLTYPADLAANPNHFACGSLGAVESVKTYTSSGTTAPQKSVFFTGKDLQTMTEFMGVGMRVVASAEDRVQVMLPSSMTNDQADLLATGIRKMGAVPVVTGITPTSEEQVQTMIADGVNVVFAPLAVLRRVTQEMRDTHDLRALNMKSLYVTQEYLCDTLRRHLQEVWGCPVYTHYGLTEMGLGVAVECDARDGYHYNEADLYLEIVDPVSGDPLPAGEEGVLVFTALSLEGSPLIRYRTSDLSSFIPQPCACGAGLKKIAHVTHRTEAMLRLKSGDSIHPTIFDDLVYANTDVIDYQIALEQEGEQERLHLRVEGVRGCLGLIQDIENRMIRHPIVNKGIERKTLLPPRVEILSAGSLRSMSRAKKLIIDQRSDC
jgi:phenylacetate-CoA ligase